jgi:hypothetical protein
MRAAAPAQEEGKPYSIPNGTGTQMRPRANATEDTKDFFTATRMGCEVVNGMVAPS